MSRAGQLAFRLTGFGWAMSVLVLGLVLLLPDPVRGDTRVMGLAMVGVGLFLAMWLVIDRLVPDAGLAFTVTLKLAALVLFYAGSALTLYGAWSSGPV